MTRPSRVLTNLLGLVCALSGCFEDPSGGASSSSSSSTADDAEQEGDGESESAGETETGDSLGEDMPMDLDLPPDSPELPQPALWYDFDGQVDDQVGDSDAVEVGTLNYVEGPEGLAAAFSGAEHIDASAYAETMRSHLSDTSLFFRVYPETYSSIQTLLLLGEQGEGIGSNQFTLQTRDGQVELLTETGEGLDHVVELGDVPSPGAWHSMVFVFTDGQVHYYLDGEMVSSSEYQGAQTESLSLALFGSPWESKHWIGLVDDFRIYDQALSEQEAYYLSAMP